MAAVCVMVDGLVMGVVHLNVRWVAILKEDTATYQTSAYVIRTGMGLIVPYLCVLSIVVQLEGFVRLPTNALVWKVIQEIPVKLICYPAITKCHVSIMPPVLSSSTMLVSTLAAVYQDILASIVTLM
jgi:hypothetical protein